MPTAGAVLLFPGAGSGRETPALVAIARAFAPLPVEGADFPYRREGRKAPDRAPKLIACVRDEAAALAERAGVDPSAVVLGGRSMGGRMCSMAVADGPPAAALVPIAHPLPPPGKPENRRGGDLPPLTPPGLFISRTRGSFRP